MKKILRVIAGVVIFIVIAVLCLVTYVKIALPNTGPAQEISVKSTPDRIARGQYLANHVNVCMDCHSQRDWTYYAGPIKPGTFGMGGEVFSKEMSFPGTLYSKNITPYKLHEWTDGEILRAFTQGQSRDGSALFPLMGYPAYANMTREDAYSVIAYLRSISPVKNEVPVRALDFPLNILVNTMPSKATLAESVDTTKPEVYGKYLVTIANCAECHSKVDKGKRIPGTEFGGGRTFNFPNHTTATSANISPDKVYGIGTWTEGMFLKRFAQYRDSSAHHQAVAVNDFNTPMPWLMYAGMREKDLSAIYAYLRTVTPLSNAVNKFTRNKTDN